MNEKEANPMLPLLTGWLCGAIMKEGRDCMKIVALGGLLPDSFEVTFASGLVLRVKVEEVGE